MSSKHKYKSKILISLVAFFTAAMCVSVGFATWITTGGSSAGLNGNIETDNVQTTSSSNLDVLTINSLRPFGYSTGYGFVNNGLYSSSVNLTGVCIVNSANLKQCLNSYSSNKQFSLTISLTTSISGGFSSNLFSSSAFILTSSNFTTLNQAPTVGENMESSFNITCSNNNSDFSFSFDIEVSWGGSNPNLAEFPDLSLETFNIGFLFKEYSL